MVVERLEVQRAVDVQVAAAVDGVTQRGAVVEFRSAYPRIVARIGGITVEPVEDREFVQWQLVGGRHLLLVVERCTQILDALPDGVLPG